MTEYTVDCLLMESPRTLHEMLAEMMEFPEWYGNNLDALHDQLTSLSADTRLTLLNLDALGKFSRGFRRVLEDSARENPHLEVIY